MLCIPYEDGVMDLTSHHLLEEDADYIENFFHTINTQDSIYANSKSQMQICGESIEGDDLYKITNLVQLLSQDYVTENGNAYVHFDGDIIEEAELDSIHSLMTVEAPQKRAFQPWRGSQILPANSGVRSQYMLKYILGASTRFKIAPLTYTDPQKSHKLAERRRRERQSYYMQKLKALMPHNTKKDKISVLESAIKYISKLKGQIMYLEQENKRMEMAKHQMEEEKFEELSRDIEVSNIEGSHEVQIRCLLSAKSPKLVDLLLALKNMSFEVRSMLAQPHEEFLCVKLTASPLPSQMQVLSCAQVRDALHNLLS